MEAASYNASYNFLDVYVITGPEVLVATLAGAREIETEG